jgi:predicted nucleotide-binding protein
LQEQVIETGPANAVERAHSKLPAQNRQISRKVFIVHGHDEGARETLARFLERLGFQAIILHEQANRGRTVIEKVEANGDVRAVFDRYESLRDSQGA